IWNTTVTGFENQAPGKGRYLQQKSSWDTIHPGRAWASKLTPNSRNEEAIITAIRKAHRRNNNFILALLSFMI
ncbi:MAG: Eco29kI family restriction endonuclease, partial [Chloroflexus sp.]